MSDQIPPEAWNAAGEASKRVIDKIFDILGIFWEPKKIVKIAEAESKAAKIKAQTEIEIYDLKERAEKREERKRILDQKNIETIVNMAIPMIEDKSSASSVSDDWFTSYFEKAKNISDSEMQILWANILSGESNSNGAFSKKTISIVSDLEKDDAKLFMNLCRFKFIAGDPIIVVRGVPKPIYEKYGINFNTLKRLEHLGLIELDNVNGYQKMNLSSEGGIFYFKKIISMTLLPERNSCLPYGSVYLTRSGKELSNIAGAMPDFEILEYTLGIWKSEGVIINDIQDIPFDPIDISKSFKIKL